ncbi:MAG: cytochrome C oxidase subunit IV family protein [Polyangiaceae bacterium]|jgi:cytochrome c oxidase subunit 4|nr:cytochrome C oxidase subunit IV family protein [Polyangiaceae bacterium]
MATSETHDTNHDHDHGHGGHGAHHVDPLWLYLGVFGGLLVMTVVTVGASYLDFGAANTAIAVLIASVKAFLVAFFFMHLRHDKPFHSLVLVSGLLFLSFLFLFTLSDNGTRNDVDDMHGKPVPKAAPKLASSPLRETNAPRPSRGVAFCRGLSILPLPCCKENHG